MRLYWRPQTRASRVEWVLAELGEPVERVLAPESGRPERFQLHPLGRVPVLEDDAGVRRFESSLETFPALRTYRDRLLHRPTAKRLFAEAPPC